MTRTHRRAALLLALAFATPATALEDAVDLGWLAGHWCGTQGGSRIEELWLERGGHLLNLSTTTRGDALVSFEYARIEARAGGVVFVAQPGGMPPVEFALVESGGQRLVFTNPAHDFPQRVTYWRDEAGLHAEIAGPGEDGEQRIGFEYSACPSEVAAIRLRIGAAIPAVQLFEDRCGNEGAQHLQAALARVEAAVQAQVDAG